MLKKILTQATPKMPKNTILEPFWTIFCHFDGLRPTKNLEGIVRSIGIYLLKIWRKITLPPQECPELPVIKPNHTLQMQHNKKYLFFWKIKQHLIFKIGKIGTGKSLSEALIFASTNLQYEDRLFIELQVQYMKTLSSNLGKTCCVQKLFLTFRIFFVHNMFSPCSAKGRASDTNLPVQMFVFRI